MKILAKTTIYAIRSLIYMLNKEGRGEYICIKDIADELDISFHFLTKIFQTLTKAELLVSFRGPSGGIAYNKDPAAIYLIDLISIFEGDNFFDECLLGLPGCGNEEPCPMHDMWSAFKDDFREKFENTTLVDLKKMKGRITLESLLA